MTRKCFFSFHYAPDNWRVSTIRNIGAIEGNPAALDNDWEEVIGGGDRTIENWINNQMQKRTCTIVLIGENTANRKWINYEIKKSWENRMGVVGIYIHGFKDSEGKTSHQGSNPFSVFNINGVNFSSIVKAYNPVGLDSKQKYKNVSENIESWIEEAIEIRSKY